MTNSNKKIPRAADKVQQAINEVQEMIEVSLSADMVAIVRTDSGGDVGWSFEKKGVKVGDSVTLADGRTTAIIDYVHE